MRLSECYAKPFQTAVAMLLMAMLAACENGASGSAGSTEGSSTQESTKAEYLTDSAYFQDLQAAALRGDYAAFAGFLKASDPTVVVSQLQQSFAGRPFDAYTAKSQTSATAHKRIVELRGTGGRLYLYLELDKVAGGWNVGEHQLDRNRRRIVTRL
ncbi:MAG: hypothetical protein AAF557_06035 [Pseudomonadota bacterium]